jgi:hypothetical protein
MTDLSLMKELPVDLLMESFQYKIKDEMHRELMIARYIGIFRQLSCAKSVLSNPFETTDDSFTELANLFDDVGKDYDHDFNYDDEFDVILFLEDEEFEKIHECYCGNLSIYKKTINNKIYIVRYEWYIMGCTAITITMKKTYTHT